MPSITQFSVEFAEKFAALSMTNRTSGGKDESLARTNRSVSSALAGWTAAHSNDPRTMLTKRMFMLFLAGRGSYGQALSFSI
ncbi:MAG TPA: hypothetical protein VNS57_10145 [Steroidobacteraceae bacterium]|nr:hypothetical protein [Steroidobacteraceae bacterium]